MKKITLFNEMKKFFLVRKQLNIKNLIDKCAKRTEKIS